MPFGKSVPYEAILRLFEAVGGTGISIYAGHRVVKRRKRRNEIEMYRKDGASIFRGPYSYKQIEKYREYATLEVARLIEE